MIKQIQSFTHMLVKGYLFSRILSDLISISTLYDRRLLAEPLGFSMEVVNNNGMTYILTVDSFDAFAKKTAIEGTYSGLPNEGAFEIFVNKNNTSDQNLSDFVNYLRGQNAGLKIMEYDKNRNKWTEKSLKEENGTNVVQTNPCN